MTKINSSLRQAYAALEISYILTFVDDFLLYFCMINLSDARYRFLFEDTTYIRIRGGLD